ncbi:MAG TPA: molecular chaperone HtpG [Rhabdochlamydiaceae bacterium]|nr:molecular chaperone HtpG [Rhabdochlamydiaceae bacterium]
MTHGTLKIHTENILPIIKRWLYSDKDIFVRELVSNACDAIRKLQILRDQNLADFKDEELKIELFVNKEAKTLQFIDTGLGMTAEEVEKYIAQIAFSGAEEFLNQYQEEKEQIIGHFGLGFYSAYMVAEKVTIDTLSYQTAAEPAFWSCAGSSDYTLEKGSRMSRGTTITLLVGPDSEEFLEVARLREILEKYCQFLPYPIFLNGDRINEHDPLWLKNPADCTEKEYLDFYHTLYPMEQDPIFWIHLNVDVPFHLQGILYFPKITQRFDWNKTNIQLFVSRVFVSESCKDLIPDFLMCLRGAIDSPDIPINVSRSSLQMDKTVRQLSSHISKKVADKLATLYQTEKEKFYAAWPEIEMIVKLGMLQDEKFYARAKDFLIWKTTTGTWTTLDEKTGTLFYTSDAHASILELYKEKEVLLSSSPMDTHLFSLLERKLSLKFQRVDGALDSSLLDSSREKAESDQIANFFRKALPDLEIEAKSLASTALPTLLIFDENTRRMRDAMALSGHTMAAFQAKKTFVVNTNNPLIESLYLMQESQPELAQDVAHHLYELSMLAQKEIEPAKIPAFITRSTQVLEKLLYRGIKQPDR